MTDTSFRTLISAALALLALALAVPAAQAAVFIPTRLTDGADGACNQDCTLREAILAANAADGPDFIVLGTGTYSLSLAGAHEDLGATGDLDVRDDLTIVGRDAANTIVDGNRLDRVFDVAAGSKLELAGVTVRRGATDHEPGGGIRVAGELALTRGVVTASEATSDFGGGLHGGGDNSVLTLVQSTVWGNQAANGGGVSAEGTIAMTNSTLSGNAATAGSGGGLYATSRAEGTIANSTITANSASQTGGGVFVESAPFLSVIHPVFKNTILAGNSAASEKDCSGVAGSTGHNLLGDGSGCLEFGPTHGDLEGTAAAPLNANLLPLAAIGGPTPVHVPGAASPAADHGSACEAVDQRGADRSAPVCEIGAVELTSQCINGGTTLCLQDGRFRVEVRWTAPGSGSGDGNAVPLTDQSGYFWFFDPSNVELTLKVLDGCGVNNRYWVFLSGLTNVGVTVKVTDTQTGKSKGYESPANQTFKTVLDTNALSVCP
jgi:CSLREA domain-containing protein